MAVNIDYNVVQTEYILSDTTDTTDRISGSVVVHVSGNMHFRHEIGQFINVGTCNIIDAFIALSAVTQHNSAIKTAVSREVEVTRK